MASYFLWTVFLFLTVGYVKSIGTLHLENDPLVAVYDNAVPRDLMDILIGNFKKLQTTGHSEKDKQIGQTKKAWFAWPPDEQEGEEDDLLVNWIRYLIKTIPELDENGPYEAVDYWLQDHPHTKPMWMHYDIGMSVESGLALHPTFSALVYLQDGAQVMILPQTMQCLESFDHLKGCKLDDMMKQEGGYEYNIPIEQDSQTQEGYDMLKQAYLVKARASSIIVFDATLLHGPLPSNTNVTGLNREVLGIHFWKSMPDFGGQDNYYQPGTIRYTQSKTSRTEKEVKAVIEDRQDRQVEARPLITPKDRRNDLRSEEEIELIVKKSPLTKPSDVSIVKLLIDKHVLDTQCEFCHASDVILKMSEKTRKGKAGKTKKKTERVTSSINKNKAKVKTRSKSKPSPKNKGEEKKKKTKYTHSKEKNTVYNDNRQSKKKKGSNKNKPERKKQRRKEDVPLKNKKSSKRDKGGDL